MIRRCRTHSHQRSPVVSRPSKSKLSDIRISHELGHLGRWFAFHHPSVLSTAQPLEQVDRGSQRAHRKLEAFHAADPVHEALHTGAIHLLWQEETLPEKTPQRPPDATR